MTLKALLLTGLLALVPLSAMASHCPKDMKKIDAAMAMNPQLTSEQMAEVRTLREQGEAYHKAGNHKQSEEVLARAMQILHIQ